MSKVYAVVTNEFAGVVATWSEVKSLITGRRRVKYKKFEGENAVEQAQAFVNELTSARAEETPAIEEPVAQVEEPKAQTSSQPTKVYAVVGGKNGFAGLVLSWKECEQIIMGIRCDFRKFEGEDAVEKATAWVNSAAECDHCGKTRILKKLGDQHLCHDCYKSERPRIQNEQTTASVPAPTQNTVKEDMPMPTMTLDEIKARQKQLLGMIPQARKENDTELFKQLTAEYNLLSKQKVMLERQARQSAPRPTVVNRPVTPNSNTMPLEEMIARMKAAWAKGDNTKADALRRAVNARLRKGERYNPDEVEARLGALMAE